ncbi:Hypothetical predicted protein [Paramuricea clavata]|uniref:Uncharacterized protein n=1 Tax=Paramuricea clavata TaxID=317549 RepID=A0A7D9IU02_PARCT|nr:Hypothetical predicted protein [Paramuricea clavata]
MLTCDGVMTVYVDGVKQNNKTSGYETAQNYTIPTGSTVLAIHCHKPGESPKILGTIHVSVVTGSKGWLCTDQYYPAWNSAQFADTSWAPAVAYWRNELEIPYGKVENISSSAKWIGTVNGTDLYCRFSLCPQRACLTIRTTRIDNHKLVGFRLHSLHVHHVAECAMKCHAVHDRCQSFNYYSTSRICELNHSIDLLKHLISAPGVTFYYRSN